MGAELQPSALVETSPRAVWLGFLWRQYRWRVSAACCRFYLLRVHDTVIATSRLRAEVSSP